MYARLGNFDRLFKIIRWRVLPLQMHFNNFAHIQWPTNINGKWKSKPFKVCLQSAFPTIGLPYLLHTQESVTRSTVNGHSSPYSADVMVSVSAWIGADIASSSTATVLFIVILRLRFLKHKDSSPQAAPVSAVISSCPGKWPLRYIVLALIALDRKHRDTGK